MKKRRCNFLISVLVAMCFALPFLGGCDFVNILFKAKYEISLYIDDEKVTSFTYLQNATLTFEMINSKVEDIEVPEGKELSTWYTDSECHNFYTETAVQSNMILYAQWLDKEEMWYNTANGLLFYPYLNSFNNAVQNAKTQVLVLESEEELTAWIEYVYFYDVTTQVKLNLSYIDGGYNSKLSELRNVVSDFNSNSPFPSTFQTISSCSYGGWEISGYCVFYISESGIAQEATKHADEDKTKVKTQQEYAMASNITTTRDSTFNNFAINNRTRILSNISTSEQLVCAVEQGFLPICTAGSRAENIYNKAKTVLRNICDDSMTDVQKAAAIYEWLILNVQYDYAAAEKSSSASTQEQIKALRSYDAWFADGVFNYGVAVCEGISKAFVLLTNIENISSVMVTNDSHAWNKIYLNVDGHYNWFGVDATHGDIKIGSSYEALSWNKFMFTDEWRSLYVASEYPEFTCTTTYDIYSNLIFDKDEQNDGFDLVVESNVELRTVLQYVKDNFSAKTSSSYFFIELAMNSALANAISSISNQVGLNYYSKYSQSSVEHNSTYIILFSKSA